MALGIALGMTLVASAIAQAQDEPVVDEQTVKRIREGENRAEIAAGYEHVGKIDAPRRQFTANQIENPYLQKSSSYINVVGSLSDSDVATLLGMIGERVMDISMVAGDERFAVIQTRRSAARSLLLHEHPV